MNVEPGKLKTMNRSICNVACLMIPVKLNRVAARALIDTGASACLLSRSVYEAMGDDYRAKLDRADQPALQAVGGAMINILGSLCVDVNIRGHDFPIKMYVSATDEKAGCLLGPPFMDKHLCEINYRYRMFDVNGIKVPLNAYSDTSIGIGAVSCQKLSLDAENGSSVDLDLYLDSEIDLPESTDIMGGLSPVLPRRSTRKKVPPDRLITHS